MLLTVTRARLAAVLAGAALATAGAVAAAPAHADADAGGGLPRQDLRSPDTRDAAERYDPAPRQDLRSPDTRDAALGYAPVALPDTTSAPPATPLAAGGFDPISAVIGAAGAGVLIALMALGAGRVHRRPSLGF